MALSKKQSMIRTYREFMEMCLSNDYSGILPRFVYEKIAGFGTALDEKIQGISGIKNLLKIQKRQSKGLKISWKIKPVSHYTSEDGNTAVFADDVFLTIKAGKENIEMYLRLSVILHYHNNQWKVIHWHGSKPEQVESEKDTWGIVSWKQRAQELERLVAEKTADLIKKNRELEIEVALEKVRAASTAMVKTEELDKVVAVMYKQFLSLQVDQVGVELILCNQENDQLQFWSSLTSQKKLPECYTIQKSSHSFFKKQWNAWKTKKDRLVIVLDGYKKKKFDKFIFSKTDFRKFPAQDKKLIRSRKKDVFTHTWMKYGLLEVAADKPLSDENFHVLQRFANVFEQAYTRFLDLQKAEAQAREAQIEAALERVRARTMAMHKSSELQEVINRLFHEFESLGVSTDASFILTEYNKKERTGLYCWIANKDESYAQRVYIPYLDNPPQKRFYDALHSGQKFYTAVISKKDKNTYFKYAFKKSPQLGALPKKRKEFILDGSGWTWSAVILNNLVLCIQRYNSQPFLKDENTLVERFGGVLNQAYTRFLDLQKAEEQAREAQIEAALERVRSRSLAMHKSDELNKVIAVLYEQLQLLSVGDWGCSLNIYNEPGNYFEIWLSTDTQRISPQSFRIEGQDHQLIKENWDIWKSQEQFRFIELEGQVKVEYDEYVMSQTGLKHLPSTIKKAIKSLPESYASIAAMKHGTLNSYTGQKPLSKAEFLVLQRFAKVFEQAYTRFLDLQKAEAQVREAENQLALERVRAATMAMHQSDELAQVVALMYAQIQNLGFSDWGCSIIICDDKAHVMRYWYAEINLLHLPGYCNVPLTNKIVKKVWKLWQSGVPQFDISLLGKEKESYTSFMLNDTDYHHILPEEVKEEWRKPKDIFFSYFTFKYGMLEFVDIKPLNSENYPVYERFAKVFEQTYTRFLDLQKAEAQAREAQIEAGLERVRSKTMAMHTSQDVGNTVASLFDELVALGLEKSARCGIGILDESHINIMELWTASTNDQGELVLAIGHLDMTLHPLLKGVQKTWRSKKQSFTYELKGEDLIDYFNALNDYPDYHIFIDVKSLPEKIIHNSFYFTDGVIYCFTQNSISEDLANVLKRFAGVFGQTYKRYLDLKKAEAQAREAQIEAALERVRSRSMAMQHSSELNEVLTTMFGELSSLGLALARCVIWTFNMEDRSARWWAANPEEESGTESFLIPYTDHPTCNEYWKAWEKRRVRYFYELSGETKKTWDDYLFHHSDMVRLPEPVKAAMKAPDKVFLYNSFRDFGVLFAASIEPLSEENFDIIERFGKVFDQSYTRFNDIEQAEAREKEAIRQASLDRVRAEIASMRTTTDLERITPLIWKELTTLNIPFIRCGVFIMDESLHQIHTFLSTPDGNAIAAFHLPYDAPGRTKEILASWNRKQMYIEHWDETAFSELGDLLVQQGAVPSKDAYLKTVPPGGVHLHCHPFMQGMLYVGNTVKLMEDDIQLIQSVADAFATAYARYEDFNKLETAKQQVDKALVELKQTQQQLIQSEKMASLGELTAGIAHEIQNPLNFVNNFSEVNKELLAEMEEAIKKGDFEEAITLSKDIMDNQEKINHHGKRAEGIVKGMLQHSRSGSGKKELTDINALCDEYLRLSYHGLRAKDKSFNAKFETHLDETLPKIEVMPQDIGRVVLNLINNAFYAVSEKLNVESQKLNSGYEPTVTVSTNKLDGKVEIIVRDNGSGIPDSIKEKIFQPFFTTKPTGQGTGLGLSLSYDIVKAHGGELKVDTTKGTGTTFTITLHV